MLNDKEELAGKFSEGVPAHCPPQDALSQAATLYRVCKFNPPGADDYNSHINSLDKNKRKRAEAAIKRDPLDCRPSGLSCWITDSDMRHACTIFDFMLGRFIFSTDVEAHEGRLKKTGDHEHHTYWPFAHVDLQARAKFVFGPVEAPANALG